MLTASELREERQNAIVISNRLIQNSYFELNMIPLKTLLYTISKIKPEDEPNKEYKISIRELCQVCNMRIKGTNTYKGKNGLVYRAMRELRAKHLDLYDEQGRAFNTGWFSKVKMEHDNDTVYYTFDTDLMPYLFNLSMEMGGLTISTMEICCALETPQGIMLYLFLRSIASRRDKVISLDEIRERTGNRDKYDAYKDLRRRILTPAIDDINKYSDMEVSYQEVKQGKGVIALDFTIRARNRLTAEEWNRKSLNRALALYGKRNPNRMYKMPTDTVRLYANIYRKAKKPIEE